MVDDRRLTISSSSRLQAGEVARRTFGITRRGFDPSQVKSYLEQVGREMMAAEEREHELRELLAEAERKAQNPVLDEATLISALGQEAAKVLRSAHDAAAELLGHAEADANRMVTEAQEEAGKLQAQTEQHASDRAAQSEAAAAETRQRAQEEAATRVDTARVEVEALIEQARAECRAMLSEAHELRARVLGDLARRRRVLHSQIEQLRAGRDRLAETITGARQTVDHITEELFRAEDEARIAAEAAGRQIALQTETGELHPSVAAGTAPVAEEIGMAADEQPEQVVREPTASEKTTSEAVAVEEITTVAVSEQGDGSTRSQTVEELFARLRAERSAEATVVAADSTDPSQESGAEISSAAVAGDSAAVAGDSAAVAGDSAAAAGESAEPEAPEHTEETEHEPLLAQRDDTLGPIVATLARRLKRALTDDQNDLLDRLRANKGWGPGVLPPKAEHIERYARAGWGQLVEAAQSGASFAGGKSEEAPSVDDIASDLAAAIVVPLRRRLEGEGAGVETGDDAALVEHVGAAFRDWKGARVERLVGDEAVAAFSRAALAVTPSSVSLRWVVDDEGAECPDCDDNALAGPVPRGEAFPTGHPHPPAHAGCRCLLAPMDA
ncbi:MAG: DivIVA domain-containing protein [Acidimicrobiales bacterium]